LGLSPRPHPPEAGGFAFRPPEAGGFAFRPPMASGGPLPPPLRIPGYLLDETIFSTGSARLNFSSKKFKIRYSIS